jgi:hypothetical protein
MTVRRIPVDLIAGFLVGAAYVVSAAERFVVR